MPMPYAYRHATEEWRAFLHDARTAMDLSTDTLTYTAVSGVLFAFRRRLTPQQVADFAQVLPAVLRALFVSRWRLDEGPVPPGAREDWTREAKALHPHHNLTPETCVAATALALRKNVPAGDLERVLAALPPFARDFWAVAGVDPVSLGPTFG